MRRPSDAGRHTAEIERSVWTDLCRRHANYGRSMKAESRIDLIGTAAERISTLARTGPLAEPVPALGRWKVRDVVAHLGGVYRWVTRIVSTGSMSGPSFTKSKLDGVELCDWFDESTEELVATLARADPLAPCPNFNPGSPNTIDFWVRRQVHESLVHCYDVESTLDVPSQIAADVAADGVDEYLDVFVRTRGKQDLNGPVRLVCLDDSRQWTIAPSRKAGRVDTHAVGVEPVAEISGSANSLLLLMWQRIQLHDLDLSVTGDQATATSFRPSRESTAGLQP